MVLGGGFTSQASVIKGVCMSEKPKYLTSDLVMGIILTIFGIYIGVEALGMRVYNTFLDAPGFFPLILGIIFVAFGVVMIIGSLRAGSLEAAKESFSKDNVMAILLDSQTKRVVILAFLMVVYIYGLIGRVHFTLATFLYLIATFIYLKSTTLLKSAIISIVSAFLISAVFQYFFKIPLP